MPEFDVVVVGAGPAGLCAAHEAARAGARVCVVDENAGPGGQLIKQIHKFFGTKEHLAGVRGRTIAFELLGLMEKARVEVWLETVAWGYFDGHLAISRKGEVGRVEAPALVVAVGASENSLVFPGWTLPGVMGAGAAQTFMNIYRVLPGKRFLMVGAGNVGLIITHQLLQAGAEVAAIVEAIGRIGGYEVHAAKVRRAGVPILLQHTVVEARGTEQVEEAVIARVDESFRPVPGTERVLDIDTICLAVGLTPSIQLLQLIGCELRYDGALGGWLPVHDAKMETTVPGVYVCGDVAGIEEASIAMEEGRIAGISAAERLGYASPAAAEAVRQVSMGRLEQLRRGARERRDQTVVSKNPQAVADEIPRGCGPKAVIECYEEIPCDPCQYACPRGAITIGEPITNLPVLDRGKCNGCGLCIPACPGMAIVVVDAPPNRCGAGTVSVPYEYLPLPEKGQVVETFDAWGNRLGKAEVVAVACPKGYDRTAVVKVRASGYDCALVRHIAVAKEGARLV